MKATNSNGNRVAPRQVSGQAGNRYIVRVTHYALLYSILVLLLFPSLAIAKPAEIEVASLITALEINGNKIVPDKDILAVVFTRVGDTISEEKIKGDVKAIYALGDFADVTSSFEAFAGGTKLIFNVIENPRINNLIIEGNTVYATAELLALISTKQGDILNFKKMQDDIEKINDKYKTDGYILARVIDVETDKKSGTLRFKVIEGRVESISLDGNENTQDYVILRELKTKPGSVLNEEVLKKDLRRVFNLGFFSEVTPNFEPGSAKDKVVLQLKIKETRTSTVNFGGGYGESEGWFGFVDLSVNNLLGTAQGILVRGQSGQQSSTYQAKYFNPWFWPQRLGDRTSFTLRRWLTIGRDVILTTQDGIYNGADVSFGRPLNDYYNITWTLGSENVSPYQTSTFEAYRSDTIGVTLAYDTRDFWLNPTQGRYYTLDLKQGWKSCSSNTSFSKIGSDLNHYYPVFNNQVLAAHLGFGLGLGDVPIGDLYWAGGANTVRGYYPSESKTGKRKLIANVEYRLNFNDSIQGVFFYDWGNAWNTGGAEFSQFLTGWGPGVRITTPLGPIRLDWGVASGKQFGEGIMHFSIGQAF
ncbi:MAG: BamA/TamA family outer membrane protein [Candidatus Margulisbacteria bacterium]|nr:BamA/TamA family outer membrane protein [Candidatus Margulisiibacteriota bacterium]